MTGWLVYHVLVLTQSVSNTNVLTQICSLILKTAKCI